MTKALNLPNSITIVRLCLAVVFFALLSQYSQRDPEPWKLDWAAGLFIFAALTDSLDGYLARKLGQVTVLGRLLDPLVDKVLVCGAFILYCGPAFVGRDGVNVTGVQAWMVVLIVGRELLVTGLRGINESMGHSFPASVHGKIKMWVQSITIAVIPLLIAHNNTWASGDWANLLQTSCVWFAVIATVLSAVQYVIQSRFVLTETPSA